MKTNNSISNAKEDNSLLGCRENLGKEDESEFCFIFIHFLSNHTLRRLDWTWKKFFKKKLKKKPNILIELIIKNLEKEREYALY